jgi:Ni/Co efflux regulator RcnB
MKRMLITLAAVAMAGCGVDVATTAATGAAIKKQELEAGKKTQEQAQQKIEQSMQQMQQRAQEGSDKEGGDK